MALWCFPIITDLCMETYGAAIGGRHASLKIISFTHSRLWQALILDDPAAARKTRGDLTETAQTMGLSLDQVCDLDDVLLNELMDVVTQRFHRSPVKASVCGHILLHIAKNLAYTPKVLAVA